MSAKQSIFPLEGQSAMIQLMVSLIIIILVSSISMTLFILLWGLLSGAGISGIWAILTEGDTPSGAGFLSVLLIIQQLSIFVIPVILAGYLMSGNGWSFYGLNKIPSTPAIVLVILLALFLIPVTGFTGGLNELIKLPNGLSGLENWLLEKEMDARETTNLLLENRNRWSYGLNFIIIVLLPAFGEELFFRGLFLRILKKATGNSGSAVVITALVFTVLHFQFYGLIPRFILGLVYGFLFVWSGSVWLPVTAHFVNNLTALFVSGFTPIYTELGSRQSDELLYALPMVMISALLCILLLVVIKRIHPSEAKVDSEHI